MDCEGTSLNPITGDRKFLCYPKDAHNVDENRFLIFHYYFQLDSILDLPNRPVISEYYYYLTEKNYYFISPSILSEKVDLIDLYSMDNLYAKK